MRVGVGGVVGVGWIWVGWGFRGRVLAPIAFLTYRLAICVILTRLSGFS